VFDPANGYLYIAQGDNGMLSVVCSSTNTVLAVLQLGTNGQYPIMPFLDPANGELYVSNYIGGTVAVISGETVVSTVRVGSDPITPFFDPQNGYIYVPNYDSNYVSVISGTTNAVIANVTVVVGANGGVFDPANRDIYLTGSPPTNQGILCCDVPGFVLIISAETNALIGNITLNFENPSALAPAPLTISGLNPDYPSAPVFDPANGDIYVSNGGGNTTSVISGETNSLLTNVVVGLGPDTPAFDPLNGDVYVPNQNGGTVSVISSATNAVVATVEVERAPLETLFNPMNGDIYVPEFLDGISGDLSIISGATNTLVTHLAIGPSPSSLALDPANGEVYVACEGTDQTPGSIWAIYSSATPQSATVVAVGQNETSIPGFRTIPHSSDGPVLQERFTPATFSLRTIGQTYEVCVEDTGGCTFQHWSGGSTSDALLVTPTSNVTLIADFQRT
jgi:YVTN family beta-propeller protein